MNNNKPFVPPPGQNPPNFNQGAFNPPPGGFQKPAAFNPPGNMGPAPGGMGPAQGGMGPAPGGMGPAPGAFVPQAGGVKPGAFAPPQPAGAFNQPAAGFVGGFAQKGGAALPPQGNFAPPPGQGGFVPPQGAFAPKLAPGAPQGFGVIPGAPGGGFPNQNAQVGFAPQGAQGLAQQGGGFGVKGFGGPALLEVKPGPKPIPGPDQQKQVQPAPQYEKRPTTTIEDKKNLVAYLNEQIKAGNPAFAIECIKQIIDSDIRVKVAGK